MEVSDIVKAHFSADDAQVIHTFKWPTFYEVLVTWGTRRNMVTRRFTVIVDRGKVIGSSAMGQRPVVTQRT